MKIDLNKSFLDLEGKEIENANMGKFLADAISKSNKGNAIKLFDWALKLFNEGFIEIDASDKKILLEFVEKAESFSILVKAQLIKEIENADKPAE